MITIRTKNRYGRKEKNFMLDVLIAMEEEVKREGKCGTTKIPECNKCAYRHVCKDITLTVQHLKEI